MKKDYTDLTIVLDRSGSMAPVRESTIAGIVRLVEDQKKLPGECRLSVVQFDSEDPADWLFVACPIETVGDGYFSGYHPRGGTPLYDAVSAAVAATGSRLAMLPEAERPERVIFVIATDGQENASRETTAEALKTVIEHQRSRYNWDFVFLGANQDAILAAGAIGIGAASSVNYQGTVAGTGNVYAATSNLVTRKRMVAAQAMSSVGFTDDEREANS